MEQPVPAAAPPSPRPRMEFPVGGVILILIGALFLAAHYGHIHLAKFVVRWWPVVLIAVGATKMVNDRRVLSPGITLALIGSFMLFFTLGALRWRMLGRIWPIVLIAVGVSMLVGARRRP